MANRTDTISRANSLVTINPPSDDPPNGAYAITAANVATANAFQVFTNAIFANTVSNQGAATLDSGATDATVGALVGTTSPYWSLVNRDDGSGNCVMTNFSPGSGGTCDGYTYNSGSLVHIGGSTGTGKPANGDTCTVQCAGNNFTAKDGATTLLTFTTSFNNTQTRHGIGTIFNLSGNGNFAPNITVTNAATSSFTVAGPNGAGAIPSNHSTNIVLTLTGTGTAWTGGGTTFTVSGVSGVAKVSQSVTSGTAATVTVSVAAVASPPAGATGTLTVSDGTLTNTIPVSTPSMTLAPTSGPAGSGTPVAATGTNTLWQGDNPTFTVTGSGASLTGSSSSSNTSASFTVNPGVTVGQVNTVTDPSTGAQASFTAASPAPLSAGTPATVISPTGYTAYLDGTNGSTAPSGGVTPYSYVWHQDTTSNATPSGGNIAPGTATTQNYTAATADKTYRFMRCVVTDSEGAPATATTVETPVRAAARTIVLLVMGDSRNYNTLGGPPPTIMGPQAQVLGNDIHLVTVANPSAPGSTSADWLPTAAAWPGPPTTGGLNLYAYGKSLLTAAGATPTHILIPIGVNDAATAVSVPTFIANVGTTIAQLKTDFPGVPIYVSWMNYGRPAGSYGRGVNATMQAYNAAILSSLVDDTTVFPGDQTSWQASGLIPAWLNGNDIHPSGPPQGGGYMMAYAQLKVVETAVYPPPAGSGGGYIGG